MQNFKDGPLFQVTYITVQNKQWKTGSDLSSCWLSWAFNRLSSKTFRVPKISQILDTMDFEKLSFSTVTVCTNCLLPYHDRVALCHSVCSF